MTDISRAEVLRYLGYRGIQPDEHTAEMIETCIAALERESSPAYITRRYPVVFHEDGSMEIADMRIVSRDLLGNLRGCTYVVMMACTIGLGADRLIRRASVLSSAEAAVYQAAGAAYVEAVCDEVNEDVRRKAEARGLSARPRFSPGYGDLSLELQKDFSRILDMPKTVGITLTDSLLMVPSKSVTALIGLAPDKDMHSAQGCETCSLAETCEYSGK